MPSQKDELKKINFRARDIIPLANTTISLCRILPV